MNLEEIVSKEWNKELLFHRPDPLGYYVIIKDMIRVDKYMKMSLAEQMKSKGRPYKHLQDKVK